MKNYFIAFVVLFIPSWLSSQNIAVPGFQRPLESLHPSIRSQSLLSVDLRTRVGGLTTDSEGALYVCTWSTAGSVYKIPSPGEDSSFVRVAAGLAEPQGLSLWEGNLYVATRQELTRLVDMTQDGVANEYQTVQSNWSQSGNYHEMAFGLPMIGENFYLGLAVATDRSGKALETQGADQGTIQQIAPTGERKTYAKGFNTPSGMSVGPDGKLLVTDNLGPGFEAARLLLVTEGQDYGFDPQTGTLSADSPQPLVWIPRNDAFDKPSEAILLQNGPYAGQLLMGDMVARGLKRISLQEVNGQMQGCAFRFSQGFEAGIKSITEAADGSIYAGGADGIGNWGFPSQKRSGLDKLEWTDKQPFELFSVEAMANGLMLNFSQPLRIGKGGNPTDYLIRQWQYNEAGKATGVKTLNIGATTISEDRKSIFLHLSQMEAGSVLYLRILNPPISEQEEGLWTNEAWYSLNQIPAEKGPEPTEFGVADNLLNSAEEAQGWVSLFNGNDLSGWRTFQESEALDNWEVQEGYLYCNGGRKGDLITTETYENFELELEWKISPGGNSGIFFLVAEGDYKKVWHTGPEMQILDDATHADAADADHRSGANYDMHAPAYPASKPVGEFNHVRIVVNQGQVSYWLNGIKVVEYELGSTEWRQTLDESKFIKMPGYGTQKEGHIAIQDHGDPVWFRNIKIRRL